MDIRIPRLGEGADSGTVVNLLVKEGERLAKDQTILELENEKAVAPIPSTTAGTLTKWHVKVGDKVSVGQLVASVSEEGAASGAGIKPAPAEKTEPSEPPSSPSVGAGFIPAQTEEFIYQSKSGVPPPASPAIRKMARELGIDLTRVKGSETGGRITAEDLRAYIERLQSLAFQSKTASDAKVGLKPAPTETVDFSKWGPVSKTPLSSLRRTIARRMVESWTAIPHVTQFDEADLTRLNELRKKHQAAFEKKGSKLTLTPFLIKAVVSVLKKYPLFNSSLDEASQEIVTKGYIHIGIAVDTDQGLIVPVIRDADKQSLLELSKALNDLAERTKARRVTAEELKGGTFTISNQGGIGGAHFTPIINRPEVAILGIGQGALKPVVRNEKIESRFLVPLALSYDHRVIDGGSAARFIKELVDAIQNFKEEDAR